MTNKQQNWEKEFDNLPQTKMTTRDFIRKTRQNAQREVLEDFEKWEEAKQIREVIIKGYKADLLKKIEEGVERIKLKKIKDDVWNERYEDGYDQALQDIKEFLKKLTQRG